MHDDLPDPGEVGWAWVPYEEDHSQGKDRPVLVIGRDGDRVVDALRDHLRAHPVRGRDALIFPGQDGALLAPSALYGREERVEDRGGKSYTKRAYGFYAAREVIASQRCTGTICAEPPQPWGHSRRPPSERCSTDSGTPLRRWRCGTRPRPLCRHRDAMAKRGGSVRLGHQERPR